MNANATVCLLDTALFDSAHSLSNFLADNVSLTLTVYFSVQNCLKNQLMWQQLNHYTSLRIQICAKAQLRSFNNSSWRQHIIVLHKWHWRQQKEALIYYSISIIIFQDCVCLRERSGKAFV